MMKRMNALLLGVILLSAPVLMACSDDDDGDDTSESTPAVTGSATGAEEDRATGTTGSTRDTGAAEDPGATNGTGGAASEGLLEAAAGLPELIEQVRPSVVTVDVGEGEGSGVIWSSSGEIITNNHVVANATTVEIVLASGERLPAEVVGTDPLTDLAVVKVDRDDLHPATFAESLPRVGQLAIAIGNPLGFESSVTLGIISGLNRAIPSGGQSPALVDLLQTDAAISPGNSGGALINANGEVIGINVAYIPPSQRAVSLGFAIPAPTVIDVVEQLAAGETVEHSFLGIEPRPLSPQIAQQLGLGVTEGVFVFGLAEGGAAAEAGIETGDVIVGLNGEDITQIEDLYGILRDTSPGDTVPITTVRDGEEMEMEVTLQDRPAQ